ncbi:MAG: 3-oxoacyl-[acyl-carrier-protein] synthase III C-terminal domain-containing protein [Blastocatellia bacterium]
MTPRLFLRNFRSLLPPFHRRQEESLAWLSAAHARAQATADHNEDSFAEWQTRLGRLVRRYGCSPPHIARRRSELEDFLHEDWTRMRVFNLLDSPRGETISARSQFYSETVNRLAAEYFADDLDGPDELLHVSCTGYVAPGPIQRLMSERGWHDHTQATQIYHHGCFAAVTALRVASGLLAQRQLIAMRQTAAARQPALAEIAAAPVIDKLIAGAGIGHGLPGHNGFHAEPHSSFRAEIFHTELCTLHFNPLDHSPEQLVVQSLFADGHIRYAMVSTESESESDALEVLAAREHLAPDSLEDMTWGLSEFGFRMTLSRDVPVKIAEALKPFLRRMFADAGLDYDTEAPLAAFAIHPGGPRIIDSVQTLLELDDDQTTHSRRVLAERGNMSSATLPHVWAALLDDDKILPGTLIISMAFGPGLTIAGCLLRKC